MWVLATPELAAGRAIAVDAAVFISAITRAEINVPSEFGIGGDPAWNALADFLTADLERFIFGNGVCWAAPSRTANVGSGEPRMHVRYNSIVLMFFAVHLLQGRRGFRSPVPAGL